MTAIGFGFEAHLAPRSAGWRWGASLAVALALHVLAAIAILSWRDAASPVAPSSAAILIDLAAPEPPAPVPAVQPPTALPQEPPPPIVHDAAPVAPPAPKPPDAVERRVPHPVIHRPVAKEPPPPAPAEATPRQSAPAAPALPATPSPPVAAAPDGIARFEDILVAHLERYKRYPPSALKRGEQGTAYLRFVVDRQGRVLNFRLERSSGHAVLDEEVLSLIRRAEPLPPIPETIAQSQIELVAPVRFVLK